MPARLCVVLLVLVCLPLWADDPPSESSSASSDAASSQPAGGSESDAEDQTEEDIPRFELSEEVSEILVPLFASVADAKVSRATVEMLTDSVLSGKVIESETATFQIASAAPDKFTIYLKQPEQRTRIYCDGDSTVVAMAPDAFFRMPDPIPLQMAATGLPVPMGPYPEPVLSLTLAGVDPAISLVAGMKSIEIVDHEKFRQLPAVHLRGVQSDAVTWDFWISTGDQPKPLRLLVDLTPMLAASGDVRVPANFSYQVRFDFLSWRVSGDVDPALFAYDPPTDAQQYESLEQYYESVAGVNAQHPLLGKPAPSWTATDLAGQEVSGKDYVDKVVVIDFWATWCTPCIAAMPTLKAVTDKYADRDVVLLAVNTGESAEDVKTFLKDQELKIEPLLDPEGKIADSFQADAIPQTIVIGKNGVIESVHVGFPGEEPLTKRLTDELDVLVVGGQIGSVAP